MPNETIVTQWGDTLALRLPQSIVSQAHITAGDSFTLVVQADGSIVLKSSPPRYDLADLIDGITPENRHQLIDWGAPAGNEAW